MMKIFFEIDFYDLSDNDFKHVTDISRLNRIIKSPVI